MISPTTISPVTKSTASSVATTVLIVDDELNNRKLLEALLRPEGYLTQSAASGDEALTSIAQCPPDLILLDVMLPDMDGYVIAGILKANPATSHIPIIMVSAQIDRATRQAALSAGAEEFLRKPVDCEELWFRVRNLLRFKAMQNHSWMLEQQVQARTTELQRFRSALDTTADAIFLVSRASMLFVEVNATACNMLGYSREELLQMGPVQLDVATREQLEHLYDALISGSVDGNGGLSESQVRCKDGSLLQVEVQRQAQRSGSDWIIIGVVRDITERKEVQQRLHRLAHYDTLTGLPNRTLFYDTLMKTLLQAAGNYWMVAVLFIDLDHFKYINDTLGHANGDELLSQFSDRLLQCVRVRDTVGRLGGDEFALILMMQDSQQGATLVAKKIRETLRAPFDLQGHEVTLTASIGITLYPDDAADADTLIKYADTAMYRAKQAGRDAYRFFTAQMNAEVLARLELEMALRKAVELGEFVLFYQPKVQLNSGRVTGVEALLRWQRPGYGLIAPQDFIPVLEDTGLIVRVGSWVIATVCAQIAIWLRSSVGPMQVAVNVCGRQFIEGDLEGDIIRALDDNAIDADLLELELTESTLMANTARTIACLQSLKNRGVHISIDDFGTGYSSLAYLQRFPVDKLKIDIAFVRNITCNPDDAAIALAIISMAHNLKLEVTAEGVETAAQLAYLRRNHCDHIQGFYFSPPLSVAELEQLLRDNKHLPTVSLEARPPNTLLLVDDESHILTSLQRLLQQDGYQVLSARSAAEGFELLALHSVQVVLCDQRMPGMNGTEFLDRIKSLYPDTLRIILSGYTDLHSVLEAINRGSIYRFYTKPWDSDTLRDNIRETFRHYWLVHDRPLG